MCWWQVCSASWAVLEALEQRCVCVGTSLPLQGLAGLSATLATAPACGLRWTICSCTPGHEIMQARESLLCLDNQEGCSPGACLCFDAHRLVRVLLNLEFTYQPNSCWPCRQCSSNA